MAKSYCCEETNKETCYGFGCKEQATERIALDAGKFGMIQLNLCYKCATKFR